MEKGVNAILDIAGGLLAIALMWVTFDNWGNEGLKVWAVAFVMVGIAVCVTMAKFVCGMITRPLDALNKKIDDSLGESK